MKIIEDNFNKKRSKTKQFICDNCKSKIEYDQNDVRYGAYGVGEIVCPLCKKINVLEEENLELTVDNLRFPLHFRSSVEGVNISDSDIIGYIKRGHEYLRENKEEYAWYTASGNTVIIVWHFDGDEDYEVIVSRDYYQTYLPFQEQDYQETKE